MIISFKKEEMCGVGDANEKKVEETDKPLPNTKFIQNQAT